MLFFLRKFFPQLFIAVILEENKSILKASTFRNGKLINSIEKSFEKNENLLEYVRKLSKQFLFYYTALFLDANEQGVIPSKDSKDFEHFGIGKISLKTLVFHNVQIYTATEHIDYFSELFEDYNGLDFLYSPFALLYYCIQKEKTHDDKIILYAYKHSQFLVLMVCKNSEILYGEFKIFETDMGLELENFDDEYKIQDDETILKEANDEEATFNTLNESLDNNFDSFEEQTDLSDEKLELSKFSNFSNDMEFCHYIITSIKKFYSDKERGSFIDKAILFTNEEFSPEAIEFLESETFLQLKTNKINTLELMIELMQKELSR